MKYVCEIPLEKHTSLLAVKFPEQFWLLHIVKNKHPLLQLPVCCSRLMLLEPGSFSLFHFLFTYKSAVEYAVGIHNKRKLLLSDLQLNAEKNLFWQDFHLLLLEELDLKVCCL